MSGTIILGIIAATLILFGLGAMWYNRRLQQSSASKYAPPAVPARSQKDELSALGILEIKPRTAGSKKENESREEVEVIDVPEPDASEESVSGARGEDDASGKSDGQQEDDLDAGASAPEEAQHEERREHVGEEAGEDDDLDAASTEDESEAMPDIKRSGVSRREALFRLLNAVQSSVDGYTACLIKRETDGRCYVEAIVSQNPQALGPTSLSLDDLIADEAFEGSAVIVKDLDTQKSPEEILGYYESPVSVRQVAIAPITAANDDDAYYLLVDALGWQDLDDPWQRLMIGQFATLLGTFMSTPIMEGDEGEFIKPRVRPRREIVAEEIERARTSEHPLALALIYLNKAEAIANAGGKAISDAERAMANRLELAVNGGRLERFGELTYGIFQDEGVSEVEAWAVQLQDELAREGDHFEGGVSIGIAMLQDRHKNADEFRADATEALREAFETGACTIIE